MSTIVVLFNLKEGADISAYEAWAVNTDLKTVRNLNSIDRFEVFKTTGVLGKDTAAPYEYIEILEVNDMDTFGKEVGTDTMRKVAGEFQAFADNPIFINCQALDA